MSEATPPIRPELLAAKIEKIENFEQPELLEEFAAEPRLVRALWFLQFVSHPENYAGGLSRFAHDLIAAQSEKVGTRHSVEANAHQGHYALADAIEIFRELPHDARRQLFGEDTNLMEDAYRSSCDVDDSEFVEYWPDLRKPTTRQRPKIWNAWLRKTLTIEAVRSVCARAAQDGLADYLKNLCELPHASFRRSAAKGYCAPWYFEAVADALLTFIDSRAEQMRSLIAETEITREIRRWTAKSRGMRRPIMFVGNTRFGKTEAIKLEAAADPGNCRLVNTPASNAITDLLREVAKSLGIEVGPSNAGRELGERIDYVLRFSRLQLIFDECQFLLPGNYSRNTAPARLNWVRRSIIDQNTPAVFVCTPQSYLPAKNRFVRTTGFVMEQFDERVLLTRQLPSELSEADLLAVARVHFTDLAEDYLRFVVDTVLATERNFVSDIEKIATLAKDNAREQGRNRPTLSDIESAMADVLPTITAPETMLQKRPSKVSVQHHCKPAAEALLRHRIALEHLGRNGSVEPKEGTA
jgi:hypothetical protein